MLANTVQTQKMLHISADDVHSNPVEVISSPSVSTSSSCMFASSAKENVVVSLLTVNAAADGTYGCLKPPFKSVICHKFPSRIYAKSITTTQKAMGVTTTTTKTL